MRLLADENFPGEAVKALRSRGHDVARTAVSVLEGRADWAGHFAVIEDDRVRVTPLPPQKP